jgi:RimJ/RimL family protein N-acetyltransferase
VGGVGFHAAPDAEGVVEIGYGVVEAAANPGFASEAVRIVLALGGELGARRIIGRVLPDNGASRRVMEKAGMSLVGLDDGYLRYGIDLVEGNGRSR